MKSKKWLKFLGFSLLSMVLLQPAFADTRVTHILPSTSTPGKVGAKYFNDVVVTNYSTQPISLFVRFMDNSTASDTLQPNGAPNNGNVDYIDLLNDPSAHLTLTTMDNIVIFDNDIYKGQSINIYPQVAGKGKSRFRVTVK